MYLSFAVYFSNGYILLSTVRKKNVPIVDIKEMCISQSASLKKIVLKKTTYLVTDQATRNIPCQRLIGTNKKGNYQISKRSANR